MSGLPIPIRSAPGIRRDGTRLASDSYSDGLWCRFQRGLPRKMGGYITLSSQLPEPVYGYGLYTQGGFSYHHVGSTNYLMQVLMNSSGNLGGMNDRTPTSGFNPSPENLWQFEILADPSGGNAQIVAHSGLNRENIANDVETDIYIGDVTNTTPLVVSGLDPQSGGIVALYPYLLTFGNFGRVDVSDLEDLTAPPIDSAFVTGSKIIRGMTLRGGGLGPSGLLWSLDSLIRATFNSPDPADSIFTYDTIADEISVLSSRGIISDMGIYFWVGVDRFYMFNGVVREIPNIYNSNFFFDNLNYAYRQKVFAYKVPRFGEIWWCFPKGNATECNHAVIYNYRENFWFDTPLPASGRTDGIFAKVYNKPFMTGSLANSLGTYDLWQHETGLDAISGSSVQPIRSYFTTGDITLLKSEEKPESKSLAVSRVEPDFVQEGNLSLTIIGEANSRAPTVDSTTKTFPDTASGPDEQTVTFKDGVRRILRFKFESNTAGGNYEMGYCIAHVEPNDGRVTG